jgi:hypothetical protein
MGRLALARHTLWRATNMCPMKKGSIYPESMRSLLITTVWSNVVPNYCYKKLIGLGLRLRGKLPLMSVLCKSTTSEYMISSTGVCSARKIRSISEGHRETHKD